MADTNGSSFTWPFIEKLEVSRWAVFTLWMATFFLGVPSNLLILGVCFSRRLHTTTRVFIAALATADLLICLLRFVDAIALASVSQYLDFNSESVVYFLSIGLLYTTALLITAIAFDRFDQVCRHSRRILTIRRAKVVAAACFVAGYIVVIPEVVYKLRSGFNLHTEGIDTFIRAIFKFLPISMYILSLITVTLLYSAIFIFLYKRRKTLAPELPPPHHRRIRSISERVQLDGSAAFTSATSATFEGQQASISIASGPERANRHTNVAWDAPSSISRAVADVNPSIASSAQALNHQEANRFSRRGVGNLRPQRPTKSQSRITRMVFIATFMLFTLWLPTVCMRIYALGGMYEDFLKSSGHANLIATLIVFRDVVYLNSVTNVFVYSLTNKRFRDGCKMTMRKLRQRFALN